MSTKRSRDMASLEQALWKLFDKFIDLDEPKEKKAGEQAISEILKAAQEYREGRSQQTKLHRAGDSRKILDDLEKALSSAHEAERALSTCPDAYRALAAKYVGDTHWQPADLGDDDDAVPYSELTVYEPTRSVSCDIADLLRATREIKKRWKSQPATPRNDDLIILVSRLMGTGRDYLGIEPTDTRDDPAAGPSDTNNTCAFFIRQIFSILGPAYGLRALPKELRYWLTPALRHLKDPYGNELI